MDTWAVIGGIGIIIGIVAGIVQIAEYLQKRREKAAALDQPGAIPENDVAGQKHLTLLRQILTERFSQGELETLCFDLGVDYENLPGKGKADKARELLEYLARRERIPELIETGKRQRPDIAGWVEVQLDLDMEQLRVRRDQADRARREMRERQRVVNLRPLDVTHTFKDRLREIRTLCEHLADANVRLVSIVGRGGMGKTALASRVLADLERGVLPVPGEEQELAIDGILYLSARSTGLGLERVYADVGRMLGQTAAERLATLWASRDMPLAAKVECLLEAMQDGLYLILLDNLEDELTEEGEIAEEGLRLFVERCLTQPGGARLIATSREQVKLANAALRYARSIPLREGLPEDEAVALLRELDPDGTLGLKDAPEEALRCAVRLTQGIPRALEILAGILREDPAASLARLLADEELFGERVVERLVAQGYQRLGENERRVMEALAVFDRPVEETAVAYLLHPWFPGMDVRGSLRRLVRSYFVSANRVTGEYSLHPLDRDYTYRQLSNNEDPGTFSQRNLELRAADFYASIRKPESEWKSVEDLTPQLAEFEHRVRAEDYDGAHQVLEPIDFDYLFPWGHCTLLVELREKLQGRLKDVKLTASNVDSLGFAWHSLGQVKQAVKLYEQALTVAREIGDREREGRYLRNLGSAYRDLGNAEQARELYKQARTIFHEKGDLQGEGTILGNLGDVYQHLGQFDQAIESYEQALAIYRETGDRRREGAELGNLSNTYRALGQVEKAIGLYRTALSINQEVNDLWAKGANLGRLGVAYYDLGQIEQAIACFEGAQAIAKRLGHRRVEGRQIGRLGIVRYAMGQVERAVKLYEQALDIACQTNDRRHESIWLCNLGLAHHTMGQSEQAIELQEEALDIARGIGYQQGQSFCLLGLGQVLLAAGQLLEAQQCCEEALALNMPDTGYQAALALGMVLLHQRDETSRDTFTDAVTRCRAMLDKTADSFVPRYALATALVGQTICDPRWPNESERAELLAPALVEYRRALEVCNAPGVVRDALRDLELIRAAGVEGLEPAFELLEGALEKSQGGRGHRRRKSSGMRRRDADVRLVGRRELKENSNG